MLFGELAPNGGGRAIAPLKFLRDVTCSTPDWKAARCAPLKADGFALHPYQFLRAPHVAAGTPTTSPISALPRLTKALDKLARRTALATPDKRPLDLYLTEFGYLTPAAARRSRRSAPPGWRRRSTIARRNPRVRQLLQYQLVDPPGDELWHSAILHRDGSPRRPTPASRGPRPRTAEAALRARARRGQRGAEQPSRVSGASAVDTIGRRAPIELAEEAVREGQRHGHAVAR